MIEQFTVDVQTDEIIAGGDGQVRALITVSGNPCLSGPNSSRLTDALASLDFMVSLDVYLNETTRHADLIMPGPPPFAHEHFDMWFYQLSVRNVASWAPPMLETELPQEWRTMLRLIGVINGDGAEADIDAIDDLIAAQAAARAGLDLSDVAPRTGPARLVDLMLRAGPYGLTLADLEAAPHGLDLGALRPRIPEVLRTASGKIELAAPALTADMPRLKSYLEQGVPEFVLIGRRHLRSNNSWMHNIPKLVAGDNRCTALVNPDDAAKLGLVDGGPATIRSRTGELTVPVEITDSIRSGVVSIPHGWGHDHAGTRTAVARDHPGVNSNLLADDRLLDALSGTAAVNGIPIEIRAAA